jgi:hypothetical protein
LAPLRDAIIITHYALCEMLRLIFSLRAFRDPIIFIVIEAYQTPSP